MRFFQTPDGAWVGRLPTHDAAVGSIHCPVCFAPSGQLETVEIIVDTAGHCETRILQCVPCGARLEVFEKGNAAPRH